MSVSVLSSLSVYCCVICTMICMSYTIPSHICRDSRCKCFSGIFTSLIMFFLAWQIMYIVSTTATGSRQLYERQLDSFIFAEKMTQLSVKSELQCAIKCTNHPGCTTFSGASGATKWTECELHIPALTHVTNVLNSVIYYQWKCVER